MLVIYFDAMYPSFSSDSFVFTNVCWDLLRMQGGASLTAETGLVSKKDIHFKPAFNLPPRAIWVPESPELREE